MSLLKSWSKLSTLEVTVFFFPFCRTKRALFVNVYIFFGIFTKGKSIYIAPFKHYTGADLEKFI